MGVKSADTPRFDVVQFVSDNCVAICMLLAIVALSFTGVGNAMFVCALGAMLCVAILTKRSMKLDLWIFIPLVIYIVIGAIATFVTYGTLTEGYVCVEAVFLAIYLAIASMGDEEAFLMRRGCVAWAIVAGAVAIVLFACNAFGGVVSRLNWPLSGANAEGIFLVIACLPCVPSSPMKRPIVSCATVSPSFSWPLPSRFRSAALAPSSSVP